MSRAAFSPASTGMRKLRPPTSMPWPGKESTPAAAPLSPVAGDVAHAALSPARFDRHLAQRLAERFRAQISLQDNLVEVELLLDRLGHRDRIVNRVLEGQDLVVCVTDDKSDASRVRGASEKSCKSTACPAKEPREIPQVSPLRPRLPDSGAP